MSQSSENEALTPQELREALLSEIEVSQQAISELNDEQLEEIVGGGKFFSFKRFRSPKKPSNNDIFHDPRHPEGFWH